MTTDKQFAANRANAQKSTGPTSEAGKARSSRNAIRHGLTARDLFVPPGDEAEFEAFQQELEAGLRPDGSAQMLVFNQILSASWRLLRCDRAEAELAARAADSSLDPMLDDASHAKLNVIERARSQASRQFHKSVAELRRIQTEECYRAVAMPAEKGCDTSAFGLADSQLIRSRLRKEEQAAREQAAKQQIAGMTALMAERSRRVVDEYRAAAAGFQPASPSAETKPNSPPAQGFARTNPFRANPAAFKQEEPAATKAAAA